MISDQAKFNGSVNFQRRIIFQNGP